MRPDLVIAADWSAAQGRRPEPGEDRCWIAWAAADGFRSEPVYAPTRLEAEDIIRRILDQFAGAGILLGIDAAIGLPTADDGSPVLPTGRDLIALLAGLITDDASGVNNRFEVAAELNRRINAITGAGQGPFWGRPRELDLPDLPATRPERTGCRKLRACEVAARRATRTKPKSPWQLAGAGSVGGQALMAAPMIHRLLAGRNARLYPFDGAPAPAAAAGWISIAEIYPALYPPRAPGYWYRDARQVADSAAALVEAPPPLTVDHERAGLEGWILGVPHDRPPDEPA